ncbi:MAG: carboxypeptidase regulatory-like domain-containing protein [Deltaproteobacteria bacterium]|nr:carboxypeptidase regulatory-like domain-containing protein [Deltaproteobacteria bacterium]
MKRAVTILLAAAPLLAASSGLGAPGAPAASAPATSAPAASVPAASAAPSTAPSTAPSEAPGARPPGTMQPGAALPPGHPQVAQEDDGLPKLPPNDARPDPTLPTGTILATIRDEADKPVPNVSVTLAIVRQSVSMGESRDHMVAMTNAAGEVRFDGLKNGSGWSYKVSVVATAADQPAVRATYASEEFALPLSGGFRVVQHRYPVATNIENLLVGVEGVDTIVEVRDDIIEVTQIFEVINAGTTTWSLGQGLPLALPKGFKAVRAGEQMGGDHTIIPTDEGLRWAGSFPPGRSQLNYDFKIPYEGDPTADIELQLPPRVLAARVRVAARKGMTLAVDGFPAAREDTVGAGMKILSTIKRGTPQEQISGLKIHVGGLPTQGNERWFVTSVALVAAALGLWMSRREAPKADRAATAAARKRVRSTLLAEVVELDRAHREGQIGPKAYARERAKLLDLVADTLDPEPAGPRAGSAA